MKKLSSTTKKLITNNTSPIKVRKKNFGFNQINSFDGLKSLRLSHRLHGRIPKKRDIIINTGLILKKNLDKYNSTPFRFYKKLTNQILFNLPYRLVNSFKDYLIWNEIYDYILNFYSLNKSIELLPKISIYYKTFTLFIPIYFPLMDLRNILTQYIKNKLKLLEITQCEDDLKDELKDMEKNIIDCNTNNDNRNNNENNMEDNKEIIFNKENNEQKLINSTEIKTENSNSVSNYFGIESIIKSKEASINSIHPEGDKIDNVSSVVRQIKNQNQKDNKMNFDLSLELASIIQLFEENNEKNEKRTNNKKINGSNIKKPKDLEKNRSLLRTVNKNMTYKNIFKIQSIDKSKRSKNSSNSLKSKKSINYSKSKKISYDINNSSKNIYNSNTYRNHNFNKIKLFLFTNSSEANSERKYSHKKISTKKDNCKIIGNISYKSFLSNKNIKKNNFYSLIKNKKRSLSKTQNKSKKFGNFKIQQNHEDPVVNIVKNNKTTNHKSKNKSKSTNKNKDDLSINKTSEYSLIYTFPSINFKNSLKSSKTKKRKDSNRSLSKGINLYMRKNYSHIDIKKIIFVKKKESNNYVFGDKKNTKLIHTIDSSFNTINSSKKIMVNKMENFRNSTKNSYILKTPKNKGKANFINLNSIESKNSLNHKHVLEKEFSTFIPRKVIKRMFFNKIYKVKLLSKPINNISMKKEKTYSKFLTTCPSIKGKKSKVSIKLKKNNKNNFVGKINIKNTKNKIMTKFNKFMTIAPKNFISSSKKEFQNDLRSSSKFSVFSLSESNPSYKNRNTFFKDKIRKMKKIMPYTDRTLEVNNKNNFMANSNISTDIKFNSQTEDNKVSINSNKVKYLNNNFNLPPINSLLDKNHFKCEFKKANKNKITYLIKNFTFDNKFPSKNNKMIPKQKNIINNNHFYTVDSSNEITKKKNQNILK